MKFYVSQTENQFSFLWQPTVVKYSPPSKLKWKAAGAER
jgi:hypothetical protein